MHLCLNVKEKKSIFFIIHINDQCIGQDAAVTHESTEAAQVHPRQVPYTISTSTSMGHPSLAMGPSHGPALLPKGGP